MSSNTSSLINNLIAEYLDYHGLTVTASAFRTEAFQKFSIHVTAPPENASNKQFLLFQFLRLFDEGNAPETQALWMRYFPAEVLDDPNVLQFEFYLHLYFAIFPLLPFSNKGGSLAKRKEIPASFLRFKGYLETRGVSLASVSEFLPYYALPFIPDPEMHPSFKPLFKPEWVQNIRSRYETFLSVTLNALPVPKLCKLVLDHSKPTSSTATHIVTQVASTNSTSSVPSAPVSLEDLDFSSIKHDLQTSVASQKCLLLQALRFKLTQSKTYSDRITVLKSLIQHDILFCLGVSAKSLNSDFISSSILSEYILLREGISRFLNVIASYSVGREYLFHHHDLIKLLFSALKTESTDNIIRQNALGILQKCSLRRAAQTQMIKFGLMEWICENVLGSSDSTSTSQYSVQYGAALLMNLALRSVGRLRSQSFDILTPLRRMLEYPNEQVRTYINGSLYSILSLPANRVVAKSTGFSELLSDVMKRASGQFESQLVYISQQLDSNSDPDQSDGEDTDPENPSDETEESEIESDQDEFIGTSLDRPDLLRFDDLLRSFSKRPQSGMLPSHSTFSPGDNTILDKTTNTRRKHLAESVTLPANASHLRLPPPPPHRSISESERQNEPSRHSNVAPVADAFLGRPRIPRTPTTVSSFAVDSEFDLPSNPNSDTKKKMASIAGASDSRRIPRSKIADNSGAVNESKIRKPVSKSGYVS